MTTSKEGELDGRQLNLKGGGPDSHPSSASKWRCASEHGTVSLALLQLSTAIEGTAPALQIPPAHAHSRHG